jgi:hypothetical protein
MSRIFCGTKTFADNESVLAAVNGRKEAQEAQN